MGHLQPNLESRHVGQSTSIAPGVDRLQSRSAGIRQPRSVGRREIENGKITMLMPHGRPQPELEIDEQRRNQRESKETPRGRGRAAGGKRLPGLRPNDRNENDQAKESLRQTGVKNSDLIFQESDAQPAQDSLQNHTGHGEKTETPDPASLLGVPKPDGQDDGEQPHDRGDEAMGMLEEYSANPLGNRKEEHVITKSGRPVRHGQANSPAGHHAAAANQQQRGHRRKPDKAIQPGALIRGTHASKI